MNLKQCSVKSNIVDTTHYIMRGCFAHPDEVLVFEGTEKQCKDYLKGQEWDMYLNMYEGKYDKSNDENVSK